MSLHRHVTAFSLRHAVQYACTVVPGHFGPDATAARTKLPSYREAELASDSDVTGVVGRNCRRIRSTNRERCPRARSSHHVPVFERLAPLPLVLNPSGNYHPPTLSAATR
jgi:hypothetical protein